MRSIEEAVRSTDNHGFITLIDRNGNETGSECSISFWDDAKTGSYEDYVFVDYA